MPAITVRGLVKTYGDTRAVDGIDLDVESGQVFALLGPNGAGKTTTVEILEGHRQPTAGEVSVMGMNPQAEGARYRERIGIVLQETAVERELTVTETLDFYGGVYPHRRPSGELIDLVGLKDKANARIKSLSGGQQRRLELALGLVGDPDLLFLDEPTTGFDPSARRQAWSIVENLASLGKTILLTTHYMDEAQFLADEIAIIAQGEIVAQGTPRQLVNRSAARARIRFTLPEGVVVGELPVTPSNVYDRMVEMEVEAPTSSLHQLTSWAMERSVELDQLSVDRPSLEDVYLELTGGRDD
ncbi:MAG TPA: ABC transporter ATP-binding protein [Acidimicrobiia bacterium]|nr:ABC transporter ATP-binding protein [Acidimicrobiia bacterium]